jgi:hypothetical protein
VTVDQLSFSHPDPSLRVSMVLIIDNPQLSIINIGVGLCPPFMVTFDYPPPIINGHYMLAIPDQPRDEIFQISSFHMTYFNYLWTLPSPLTTMEGIGYHVMAMPLSIVEVAYSTIQQSFTNPDLTPTQELYLVLKPIWAQGSLVDTNYLELFFPSAEVIIEAMTSLDRPGMIFIIDLISSQIKKN